uniref:FAS1 domain-containing protein n=1 Tax=Populus alba TaxID=43335 RepID=A0A4U5NPB5_POPAL|nr:putative fasciclin-like arabinogalactan protein 20 [Populus alba]TKR84866.1 hypothetical protein D5086_0000252190 [Populus alba]
MATRFLMSIILLSLLISFSSSLPTDSILDATQILSNSGYVAMALILEFGSQTDLIPPSQSLTIFSPSDTAFSLSGQPSLDLLHFHFTPRSFSLNSLKSLPPGYQIPTLFSNHSLVISSNADSQTSVNGVKINGSALYDDGFLVIFGVDNFLDPDFTVSGSINGSTGGICECHVTSGDDDYSFEEASGVLKSRGYSVMASFLDLQLAKFKDHTRLTILAPVDEIVKGFMGDFSDYRSIFLRHVVPCKISWRDLVSLDDGVVLPTYLRGFKINVTVSSTFLMFNGVQVIVPEIYSNSWLAVHGLEGSLVMQEPTATASNAEKIVVDFKAIKVLIAFYFLLLCTSQLNSIL